jgi:diguanylate cyclase (GGDEF)-like protein
MLDNRTLMLVLLLTSLVQSVVMTLISLHQRQYQGPRHWAWASWLVLGGVFLILFRGEISNLLSVVVSNAAIFGAFALITHGIFLFLGLPGHSRWLTATCVSGVLVMVVFLYVHESTAFRVVFFALTSAVLLLDGCLALLRKVPAGGAWAYRFAGAAVGVAGLYQLVRAAVTPFVGHPDSYFSPNPVNALNSLVFIFTYQAMAVGLIMMVAARLSADLQAHMSDLRDEIGIRKQAEERLAKEATQDPLTGADNRRKLFEDAARALALCRRHGRPLAAIMLDLDHFKEINDRHGHEVGDTVLQALTVRCRSQLRLEDSFARYGGEEFVVLLPEADASQALALTGRLRSSLASLGVTAPEGLVSFTCSFGVAELAPQDQSFADVLRRADQALYQAKNQGRDRVVIWQPEGSPA